MFDVPHFYTLTTMPEHHKAINLHHNQWTIGGGWRLKYVLQHIITVILGNTNHENTNSNLAQTLYDDFVQTNDELTVHILHSYAKEMTLRDSNNPFIIMATVDNDPRQATYIGYEN